MKKKADIYTCSRHGFDVGHDAGVIWKQRRVMTVVRTPTENGSEITNLIEILVLHKEFTILTTEAHTSSQTLNNRENHLADIYAKTDASQEISPSTTCIFFLHHPPLQQKLLLREYIGQLPVPGAEYQLETSCISYLPK